MQSFRHPSSVEEHKIMRLHALEAWHGVGDRIDPLPYVKSMVVATLAGLKKKNCFGKQLSTVMNTPSNPMQFDISHIYNIRIHLDYSIINSLQDTRSPIFVEKICSSSFYHLKIKPSRLGCFAGIKRQLFSFSRNRPYSLHSKAIRKVRLSLMLVATLERVI